MGDNSIAWADRREIFAQSLNAHLLSFTFSLHPAPFSSVKIFNLLTLRFLPTSRQNFPQTSLTCGMDYFFPQNFVPLLSFVRF